MPDFKIKSKVWLESEQGRVFGDGPSMLLEYVEKLGSLRQAAKEMEMSYAQALEIINMIEENLGYTVVARQVGGSSGGGSYLTKDGKELLEKYKAFRTELTQEMEKSYNKYFGGE